MMLAACFEMVWQKVVCLLCMEREREGERNGKEGGRQISVIKILGK